MTSGCSMLVSLSSAPPPLVHPLQEISIHDRSIVDLTISEFATEVKSPILLSRIKARRRSRDGKRTVGDGGDGDDEASVVLLSVEKLYKKVLEVGIIVHSVVIGISLGASQNPDTAKALFAALMFHQCFEGLGLGGCIAQGKFNCMSITIMSIFFSVTTPIGIAVGMGIANSYNESSQTALIVQGVLNAASAGILIYMSLVDFLAADFMHPKMQSNTRLRIMAHISLLIGAGIMSLLAKWA
ncbi:hypothetical protein F2Q69_00025904 [Brassica cretica]|uniref:Zinc/iron permease n=1 Tax=Brassica cretica TaxID=69181 RepID=A0A8S9RTG1_BRACR|nr:hypothetical protein F2Q69_00025904 [Brassica cretica]